MKLIKNAEFGGERPLFESHDLRLENVIIRTGESAIKECSNIEAVDCRFEGNYPFWHVHGFKIDRCYFDVGGRSALWYSDHLKMTDTIIDAPKMFREMDEIDIENVTMNDAVEIHHAKITTKDAFWEVENVTIYDSELNGEYLGWHSKNLRLVNCHITGEQPLCYAHDLILENCTFGPDCDRTFEYSTLQADIHGAITNIKNPMSGCIVADEFGSITIDENIKAPADCEIRLRDERTCFTD